MPRPGCVWTHTLLVRFADLAVIESLERLDSHFRYPESPIKPEAYSAPLDLPTSKWLRRPVRIGEAESLILEELYGFPEKRVLVDRPNASGDELVLALWSQQWPRLRRSFSFCSLCTRDRSANGISFDLQLISKSFRSGGEQARVARNESGRRSQAMWLCKALRDLERPNEEGLRSFLKLVGSDVDAGREAFEPLCTLFARLHEGKGEPRGLRPALATLEDPSLAKVRTARAVVANIVAENIEHIGDAELSFLWKNMEYIDKQLISTQGDSVVRELWRRTPEGFEKGSWDNETQRKLIDATIETTELSELLDHVIDVAELEEIALRLRPQIMHEEKFWRNTRELAKSMEFAGSTGDNDKVLKAMIAAERKELARLAVSKFGHLSVLLVIADLDDGNRDKIGVREWAMEATRDAVEIARVLREEKKLDLTFLSLLAKCISEDVVRNEEGEDPWLIALQNARAVDRDKELDLYLAVFLLCRAFSRASRSPGQLMRAGFESVDRAVAEERLPEELWRKLERYLPTPMFWFDWSRTHRMRSAMTDLFVDGGVAPEDFVQITSDSSILRDFVRRMSWSRSGREYLDDVMRYVESEEKSSKKKSKGTEEV